MKPAMRLANSTTYWMALVMWCAHCCHIHSADWGGRHKNRHVITTWMGFSHGSQAGGSGPLCRAPCEPCSGTRGFPRVCTAPRWISSCLRRCTDTSPSETWRCSEWCGLKQQMCRARVSMWFSHIVLFTALGDFFRKRVDHGVIITLLPPHSYICRWCPSTEDKSPDGSAALDGSFLLLPLASIGAPVLTATELSLHTFTVPFTELIQSPPAVCHPRYLQIIMYFLLILHSWSPVWVLAPISPCLEKLSVALHTGASGI